MVGASPTGKDDDGGLLGGPHVASTPHRITLRLPGRPPGCRGSGPAFRGRRRRRTAADAAADAPGPAAAPAADRTRRERRAEGGAAPCAEGPGHEARPVHNGGVEEARRADRALPGPPPRL